ncbi:hypothetical protein K4K53_012174 [Colletotrichum sp. SAR 10_77]|nr:hypothetical protein K4K53_012174 [Colletotrichum sp. SAR 10_77]
MTASGQAMAEGLLWANSLLCIQDEPGVCLPELYGGNELCSDCGLKFAATMLHTTAAAGHDPRRKLSAAVPDSDLPWDDDHDRMIADNYMDYSCRELAVGMKLCIQDTCSIAQIQQGQTCEDITSGKGLTIVQLTSWNPTLKTKCDSNITPNLDALAGRSICVDEGMPSPTPLSRALAVYTPDRRQYTLQPAPDPVVTSTPHQPNLTLGCSNFHKVASGQFCADVGSEYGISLDDFYK